MSQRQPSSEPGRSSSSEQSAEVTGNCPADRLVDGWHGRPRCTCWSDGDQAMHALDAGYEEFPHDDR